MDLAKAPGIELFQNRLVAAYWDLYQMYVVQDKRKFIYRIDAKDRIVFANAEWYAFASENAVTPLTPETVIGLSLWHFICDSETRHIFEVLLKKVRESGKTIKIPFRCDSPDCRRFMELQINRYSKQEIEFCSRIIRLEMRPRVRLMESQVERTNDRLVMCGWCKKIELPDLRWVEVETALNELHLFAAARLPLISHGMCNDCNIAFQKSINVISKTEV